MDQKQKVLRLAQVLYSETVISYQWDNEQVHLQYHFMTQAESLLKRLEKEGLTIAEVEDEEQEQPKKATRRRKKASDTSD